MNITYKDLQEILSNLSEEQLNSTVTVWLGTSDECFAATFCLYEEDDILDAGHPVLYLEEV